METPPISPPQSQDQLPGAMDNKSGKLKRTSGRAQAYQLRELAFNLALRIGTGKAADSEKKAARDVTGLIRAWSEADDRVRIHRNKPLPGSLRPKEKPKTKRLSWPEPVPSAEPTPQPAESNGNALQ
jgi:hypothetical protein